MKNRYFTLAVFPPLLCFILALASCNRQSDAEKMQARYWENASKMMEMANKQMEKAMEREKNPKQ